MSKSEMSSARKFVRTAFLRDVCAATWVDSAKDGALAKYCETQRVSFGYVHQRAVTILKLAEQVATDKAVIAARFVDVNIPALGL